jgi:CRP-like cAMP-binding protein
MNEVFNYLSQFHALSSPLKEYLQKTLRLRSYGKHAILLQEGEVCKKVWYLKKGLVRCFYYRNEYEVTTWFMNEGHAILAAKSFFDQRKSKYYIEALEPCDVYYIEYANVSYAFEHFPESVIIRTRVADFYSNLMDLRVRATSMLEAGDRYHYMERHFPFLMGRVPLKYMASYLDMNVRTLTKIRHRESNRG